MMITQIMELNKTRSKIYIDGEFAFVLYKGEIRSYGLQEGREIPEELYTSIIQEVLTKRAKLRCMNLLKSREYTTEQLRRKLREGFYPAEVIEEAIAYVISYHYLDDTRYATDYVTYHMNDRSRKRIEMDLLQKGIDRQLIDRIFLEVYEDTDEDKEEILIRNFLDKKGYSSENMDDAQRKKIVGSLYRKGFSLDKIYKALRIYDV